MKLRGVNLGNWLVLEKWMSRELFEGLSARDEYDFYHALSPEEAKLRLHMHRSYFIQERDFEQIAALGLNAVRIPVPYYLFGDVPGFMGCVEYLDRAMDWAAQYGLLVLIDLHTVPGSQNGFDNGGMTGVIRWHTKQANIEFTLQVIERLAERYANDPALYGIELLNEPISEQMWQMTRSRYLPASQELAEGSSYVPSEVLRSFYLRGYEAIRRHTETAKVVLHDGFRLAEWSDFMPRGQYPGVVLDTHMYLAFEESSMKERSVEEYAGTIHERFALPLQEAGRSHEVIVGEWCIANKCALREGADAAQTRSVYRSISQLERLAFDACDGWFFWSYKLHENGRRDWDYLRAINSGWLV